ncbi:hypothetical protein QTP88_019294 [Uroleucon formosanum]
MFSDTVDNSTDEDPKGNKLTLADKLLLSTKKTPPQKKGTKKSVEEFYERMEDTERAKTAAFEIIGQRLQAIADKAKEARTTPRTVQTAVTEALDAFRWTNIVRMERLLARSEWIKIADQGKKVLDTHGTNSDPNNASQDRLLAEIRRIDARLIEQDHKINTLTGNVTTIPQHRPPKTDPRNDTEERFALTNNPWVEVAKRKLKTAPTTVLGTTNVEMVNTAIKKAVGGTATVSTLGQSVRVGVFSLDEITTTEEVAQGFTNASGTETEVEVVLREMSRERACGTKISDATNAYQTHIKPEIATGPIALAAAWVAENQDT